MLIIASGQEANGDYLGMSLESSINNDIIGLDKSGYQVNIFLISP